MCARKTKVLDLGDGFTQVSTEIPTGLWDLATIFAAQNGFRDPGIALRMFMRQAWLAAKGGTSEWLGDMWGAALAELLSTKPAALSTGLEGVQQEALDALQRNPKAKSGFAGVYSNGKGYRASAWVDGVERTIGTSPSAEAAAYRRLQYYRANNLPYGDLETEMIRWRAKDPVARDLSDRVLIEQILDFATTNGLAHKYEREARVVLATLPADDRGGWQGALMRSNGYNHETGLPLTEAERLRTPTHSWQSIVPRVTVPLTIEAVLAARAAETGLVDPAHAVGAKLAQRSPIAGPGAPAIEVVASTQKLTVQEQLARAKAFNPDDAVKRQRERDRLEDEQNG